MINDRLEDHQASAMRSDNEQPIGIELPEWRGRKMPPRTTMEGRYCRLEPLDPERHTEGLLEADQADTAGANWTYLPYGPFADPADYRRWIEDACSRDDPQFFAVVDSTESPVGVASYLRIDPLVGAIEVGHINYSPLLQRSKAATEAMSLMMRRVFDELGYRRYEWKCDALNAASRRAAERLGFVYEGTHRQATIYKGRNRDTAWYSIIDSEWPRIRRALETWLDPDNFDSDGLQRVRLNAIARTETESHIAGGR